MPLQLRPRRPDDLPVLLALLQRTHEQEGYPVRAQAVSSWWLAPADELWSAVALDGDRVVGHVALHPPEPDGLPAWQTATGRGSDGLMAVSRLFTDRTVPGAGGALLDAALRHAAEAGREAVLLVDPDSPARGFYRRRGWREVGVAVQTWGHRTVGAVLMCRAARPPGPVSRGTVPRAAGA